MNLPVIEKGRHLQKPYILHRLAEKVVIGCKKGSYAQLDGELIDGNRFEITVTPKRFLFKY